MLIALTMCVLADNVELEIVLPATMTVSVSHDIALALQHKIEEMEDVERSIVHVSASKLFKSCLLMFFVY